MTEELAQPGAVTDLQPKMRLSGVIKETQLYGAVVDIGLEYNGVVHISQLAPRRVNRVVDVVQPGDEVTVWVTKVNSEKGRIGLTMVQPAQVDWNELEEGQIHTGTVTRMERYGAFVDIGAERPGLLHVREMSAGYVQSPSDLVHRGERRLHPLRQAEQAAHPQTRSATTPDRPDNDGHRRPNRRRARGTAHDDRDGNRASTGPG